MPETQPPTESRGVNVGPGDAHVQTVSQASSPGIPPAASAAADVYRPLSLLALAGFVLALLYCGMVIVCAIVSFFGSPLLLPTWTLLAALAAAGFALAGWLDVHNSEGTKAGKALAVWAISLCVVFGLGSWAYYAATYVTVRQQADQCARQWFEHLQDGNMESAFRLTLPPENRPREGPGMRADIEFNYNTETAADKTRSNAFTGFKQMEITRMLRQAGRDIEIKPLGVTSWEPVAGGYKVTQTYHVTTPQATMDIRMTAQSSKGRRKQFETRQWFIVAKESGIVKDSGTPTELGKHVMALQGESTMILYQWIELLRGSYMEEAFLLTREPDQRLPLRKVKWKHLELDSGVAVGLGGQGALTTLCAAACRSAALETKLPGFAEFARGELVRVDEDAFWAPPPIDPAQPPAKETVLADVKKIFRRQGALPAGVFHADAGKMLFWKRVGNRIQIEHDVTVRLRSMPQTTVDAVVLVECDASALEGKSPFPLHIAGVELKGVRPGMEQQQKSGNVPPGMPDGRGGVPNMDGFGRDQNPDR
jgi:hypothetical protein